MANKIYRVAVLAGLYDLQYIVSAKNENEAIAIMSQYIKGANGEALKLDDIASVHVTEVDTSESRILGGTLFTT